ncbi:CDP-glucose 4,6-dehydratase [Paenibacillus xylanexedens]|uniref:CDP-glucose 4,6-dehydratase n=1 Tax=Paenibacillus xylanexedens TaxID=528191 RepID=UPI003CFD2622
MQIYNEFVGKTVLITGDTGFKGAWLAFWLSEMGANVIGYSLPTHSPDSLYSLLGISSRIMHIDGDLNDEQKLLQVFVKYQPEFVFHLAAQPLVRLSYRSPKLTFETNFNGSLNLLECIRNTDSVRSLVFVTSDKCYRNKEWVWGYRENDELGGGDPYSASKAVAEVLFTCYMDCYFNDRSGFGGASARTGNVIGGGDWAEDRIVPDCIRSLMNNSDIQIRQPNAIRPWQHVLEVLHGYLLLAKSLYHSPKKFSGAWNFGPSYSDCITVKEMATKVMLIWDTKNMVNVRSIEKSTEIHESAFLRVDSDKARLNLGWSSKWSAEKTISETVMWYKQVWEGQSPQLVTYRQIDEYMSM